MSESDFIEKAAELAQHVGNSELVAHAADIAADAGGFVISATGSVIANKLVSNAWEKLCERLKQAKDSGSVAGDFGSNDHDAALLQEALRALSEGLDEQRAKAVQDVFIGLAKNPPETSLEKVKQLEAIRTASQLTNWELVAINLLERYSIETFDATWAQRLEADEKKWRPLLEEDGTKRPYFDKTISDFCDGDTGTYALLDKAIMSLRDKNVVESYVGSRGSYTTHKIRCRLRRDGAFTKLGWKVAEHLYMADPEGLFASSNGPESR